MRQAAVENSLSVSKKRQKEEQKVYDKNGEFDGVAVSARETKTCLTLRVLSAAAAVSFAGAKEPVIRSHAD